MPRKQSGYVYMSVPVIGPDGIPTGAAKVAEFDSLTCAHCNRMVLLNPQRTRARGFCYRCDNYVCDYAVCRSECNPIIQGVELALKYAGTMYADQPFLLRGEQGAVLFDTRLRDAERVF